MKYLLDGYNLLFREKDAFGSLEEQRIRLFEKLNLLAEASQLTLSVILDAHRQVGELERHHFYALEVVYTDFDQTADEYIIEYVERLSPNKRHRTRVVTSDKTLMQKVRFECVEVLSVASFFKEIEKKAWSRLMKTGNSSGVGRGCVSPTLDGGSAPSKDVLKNHGLTARGSSTLMKKTASCPPKLQPKAEKSLPPLYGDDASWIALFELRLKQLDGAD